MENPRKLGVREKSGDWMRKMIWTEFILVDPDGIMTSVVFNNVDDRTLAHFEASERVRLNGGSHRKV